MLLSSVFFGLFLFPVLFVLIWSLFPVIFSFNGLFPFRVCIQFHVKLISYVLILSRSTLFFFWAYFFCIVWYTSNMFLIYSYCILIVLFFLRIINYLWLNASYALLLLCFCYLSVIFLIYYRWVSSISSSTQYYSYGKYIIYYIRCLLQL